MQANNHQPGLEIQDAALLIDWENLKYSLASEGQTVSISSLRDAADKFGRLVVARAYADWQERSHAGDAPNLYVSGIEPVYVPCKQYFAEDGEQNTRRKNSVDVKLTADCIELCHRYPSIHTYILVSGDQDFLHVVNTLRPYGKRTVAIGVSWSTSPHLAEQVDAMLYYDRDIEPAPVASAPPAQEAPPIPAEEALLERAALELVTELHMPGEAASDRIPAVLATTIRIVQEYRDRGQGLLLSQLGLELQKRISPSDFSMYVRGRLGQIANKLTALGMLQRVERGLVDWIFLPGEEVPEEIGGPSPLHSAVQTRYRYKELTRAEKDDIIRYISDLKGRVQYLSFNRLAHEIAQDDPAGAPDLDVRQIVSDMLNAEGILLHGERRQWFDSASGKTGEFDTVVLNTDHPEVMAALSP